MIEIKSLASGSSGNCYWISDGSSSLLIEAGLPIKKIKRKLNFKLNAIDGCLISHEHGDHSKAVDKLIKMGIDCYMSIGTAHALGYEERHHRIKVIPTELIAENRLYQSGYWYFKPLVSEHDAEQPVNYFILNPKTDERLLYLTDTFYSKNTFKRLNYILIEINYSKEILDKNVSKGIISPARKNRVIRSHMGLSTAKEFLRANDLSKVKEIWLLHLSDQNSNAELFKKEIMSFAGKPVRIA